MMTPLKDLIELEYLHDAVCESVEWSDSKDAGTILTVKAQCHDDSGHESWSGKSIHLVFNDVVICHLRGLGYQTGEHFIDSASSGVSDAVESECLRLVAFGIDVPPVRVAFSLTDGSSIEIVCRSVSVTTSNPKAPSHIARLLGEHSKLAENAQRSTLTLPPEFVQSLPRMYELLQLADVYEFHLSGKLLLLLAWQTSGNDRMGWVCRPFSDVWDLPEGITKEHQLFLENVGEIEDRVGEIASVPWQCGVMFSACRGLGADKERYLEACRRSGAEITPDPDDFLIFGLEGSGDKWVYDVNSARAFLISYGPGIPKKKMVRVEKTPILVEVNGMPTFLDFIEQFAEAHLSTIRSN